MEEKTKNFDDIVPVVHRHWILEREPSKPLYLRFRCSVCGNDYRYIGAVDITPGAHRQWEWFDEDTGMPLNVATFDHCPNCKVRMDGDENV